MKMSVISGSSIAIAAVALALSGASITPSAATAAKTVKCIGANACKGMSACKTASNACKGQNSCKGHGFLMEKSKAACTKAGGTVG